MDSKRFLSPKFNNLMKSGQHGSCVHGMQGELAYLRVVVFQSCCISELLCFRDGIFIVVVFQSWRISELAYFIFGVFQSWCTYFSFQYIPHSD
jgi:hypothetical protein